MQATLAKAKGRSRTESLPAFAARYANDFLGFTQRLKIQPKEGGGRIPFVLSPLQAEYNGGRTPRDIVLKGRQVHMTTLECARDLWWFLTKQGARVVVVVQSVDDQAPFRDVCYKLRLFIEALREAGVDLPFGIEANGEWGIPSSDATMRVIQAGASEASASKKGRAGTVNRLHVTEAAFYEQAALTMGALAESVAGPDKGTEIVIESTANGAGGWYFEQWRAACEARSGYTAHFLRWWHHPEYVVALNAGETFVPANPTEETLAAASASQENLKWWRRKVAEKGLDHCLQEYPSDTDTCFLVTGRSFFDAGITSKLIAAAKAPQRVESLRSGGAVGEIRHYAARDMRAQYVLALDPSEGVGGDPCAGTLRERSTGRHMATIHGQIPPWELARVAAKLGLEFGAATIAVERNNHGHAVLRSLAAEQHYPHIFRDRDERPGWLTNETSRTPALDTLSEAHRRGNWTSSDVKTLSEIRTFVVNERGKAEAMRGSHDDLVMAEAICWDVLCRSGVRRDLSNLPAR